MCEQKSRDRFDATHTRWVRLCCVNLALWLAMGTSASAAETQKGAWRETLVGRFGKGPSEAIAQTLRDFPDRRLQLEALSDWVAQDKLDVPEGLRTGAIRTVLDVLGPSATDLRDQFDTLARIETTSADRRWAELYLKACTRRRRIRLERHRDKLGRIVFTKHYDLGGSHYAYTEGQSDAQAERHFEPGSSLCVLRLDGLYGGVRSLIEDHEGVIRDPDVSYDGKRVLFAWKKSLEDDDYHLYEMDLTTGTVRQLTFGLGFADYEGAYLPNGDIVFNSTRCVQTVDCWWTEVSNLFTCDGDGRFLRRLSYDQVHTNYPTVAHDGRVIYTRWDYNDRGQIFPQGLFQMNPDGTGQRELYGNNSWFPTALLHARGIPDTHKVVAVFSGHHTLQQGWLGMIDPARGRQENNGAQLIAPVRNTPAARIDKYGQSGDQFQYPYPLSETEFLVTFRPEGARHFGIYFMTAAGERELLVSDPEISCNQPVPLAPRPVPPVRSSSVDYRKDVATVSVHDLYAGDGLKGIPRGTVKSLRVVALEYRAAGVGRNHNRGPAGGALVSSPVSIEGTWDVKKVLGTAKVYADGSACFTVPARTPIYFQALDAKGHAVQSMRSWVTLQPGEHASCVGCHDHKNVAPPITEVTRAVKSGPSELIPWHGEPRGFSFNREIQPILDRHCIGCHNRDETQDRTKKDEPSHASNKYAAFSLKGKQRDDPESLRKWSDAYKALANRKVANWINVQSGPTVLPPYHAGAAKSRLIEILEEGHYGVELGAEEMDRIVTWIDLLVPYCGDYRDGLEGEHLAKYQHFEDKRNRWDALEAANIERLIQGRLSRD